MLKLKNFLIISLVALSSACGYFSDDPVQDSDLYNSDDSLSKSCTLSPDQLSQIFDQDIEEQIKCLRENIIQFSRYVRSNNSGSISKDELQLFVRKFFAQSSDSIIKGLHVVFEINMILLRDHATSISNNNIDPLYRLLLSVNKQGLEIANSLRLMTSDVGHLHFFTEREKLRQNLEIFGTQMKQVVSQRQGMPQRLNIKDFILDLNTRFELNKDFLNEDLIDSLIFLKQLFIGGEREIITSDEILVLIDVMPELVMEAFDLIFSNSKVFPNENDLFRFYQQKIVAIKALLHPINEDEVLFDEDDIYRIYEALVNAEDREDLDLNDYRLIIQGVKQDLIGGHPKDYTFNDLKKALLLVNLGLEAFIFKNETDLIVKDIDVSNSDDLNLRRADFLAQTQKFKDQFYLRVNEIPHLPAQAYILNFFKTLNTQIDSLDYDTELVEAVFAIKTLSVGGDKAVITKEELFQVIEKLHVYSELYFDLRYTLNSLDPETDQRSEFYHAKINQVESLFIGLDANIEVLTQNDVFALINAIEEDELKQEEFKKIYNSFKSNVLRSSQGSVTFIELKKAMQYGKLLTYASSFIKFHQKVFSDIKDISDAEYELLKTRYISEFSQLTQRISQSVKDHQLIENDIFYFTFLSELVNSLDVVDFDLGLLKDLLPIKKLLVGGSAERINQVEFLELLQKSPDFIAPVLDLTRSGLKGFDKLDMIEVVAIVKRNLFAHPRETFIVSVDQILSLAGRFIEDMPIIEFKPTIEVLKKKILGGEADAMTSKDFKNLFELAHEFTELSYFTEETYRAMKDSFENSQIALTVIPKLNLPQYANLRSTHINKYYLHFKDIALKHRYFTNRETKLQFWGHEIYRTEYGFQEISSLKWLIEFLIKGWGSPDARAYKGYVLSIEQMEQALLDFKPILVEFGLWTQHFDTFARNALLLADLFQNSSNGDVRVGLDELSEFATLILSAINMSNMFLEKLTKYCTPMSGTTVADYSFETDCYRRHFYPVILNELGLKRNLPMLDRFYRESIKAGSQAPTEYLINVEGFARSFPDDVEMVRREFTLVIGAIMNIETTFIRFDLNRNNKLDPHEVDKAFLVYENAIMSIADLSEDKRKYAKSIFLYMLKYMKLPTQWQLISFHYNPFMSKKIDAYRLNVGVLLYYLVNTEEEEH